jgi:hypothetical protein
MMSFQLNGVRWGLVMADAPRSDADCIQSAYEALVGNLYTTLFQNLAGDPGNDQKYVTAFTAGWQLAKHAKQLALGVVGSPAAAAKATS